MHNLDLDKCWKAVLYDKDLDLFERALNHRTATNKKDFKDHNNLVKKWNKSWKLNLPEEIKYDSFYKIRGELAKIDPHNHKKFILSYLNLMKKRAGKGYFKMDKYAKARKLWKAINQ